MTDPSGDVLSTNHSYHDDHDDEYDHDSNLNSDSQSNSHHTTTMPTTATPPPPTTAPDLRLPDGRIIDGKNTLQSFDAQPLAARQAIMKQHSQRAAASETPATETTPNVYLTNRNSNNNNLGIVHNGDDDAAVHTEANSVHSVMIVDAEMAHSQLDLNQIYQHNYYRPPAKRSVSFWLANLFAMMLVSVVTGVGVYCGTGNCGSDSTNTSPSTPLNDNTPASPPRTIAPLAPIPPPTNSPMQQPLPITPIPPPTNSSIQQSSPITNAPLIPITPPTNIPTQIDDTPSSVPTSIASLFDISEIDSDFVIADELFALAGLDNLEGEFTLLGPGNNAWFALGNATLEILRNRTDLLRSLLREHLIEGILRPSDLINGDTVLTTIEGSNVSFAPIYTQSLSQLPEYIFFGGALSSDVYFAGNGIVYKIDRVLLAPRLPVTNSTQAPIPIPPPINSPMKNQLIVGAPIPPQDLIGGTPTDAPTSITSIFDTSEIDSDFAVTDELFALAGLDNLEGEFTLLGPGDDAWFALGYDRLARLRNDTDSLRSLLRNHLIAGIFRPIDLIDGDVLTTVGGSNVTVVPTNAQFFFDGALSSDVYRAGNGIVYIIDRVLPG